MSTTLAAIGGAATGAGGSLLNTLLSSWLGRINYEHNQKAAYNYTKKGMREFPLAQRQGLEKAGFNPMLAFGNIGSGAMPSVSQPSAAVGDIVGSAREGAKLANDIMEGIKLDNAKKEKEIENLESDLKTKQTNRDSLEASTSLTESQKDRSDLSYIRDILSSVFDALGFGASMYGAHELGKAVKGVKGTKVKSPGSSPKGELPKKGVPSLTGSAKAAKEILKVIPAVGVGAVGGEIARRSSERVQKRVNEMNGKKERYWQPRRILLH